MQMSCQTYRKQLNEARESEPKEKNQPEEPGGGCVQSPLFSVDDFQAEIVLNDFVRAMTVDFR